MVQQKSPVAEGAADHRRLSDLELQTEAHARKIMQAIGKRRYRKLAEIRDLAGLDGDDIWTLTRAQAWARRDAA